MGLLINGIIKECDSVEEYDKSIADKQEQIKILRESRRRLIKEQWEIIEIQFHEKDHWEDQRLTVEYRDLNKNPTQRYSLNTHQLHNFKISYKDIRTITYIKKGEIPPL